MGEKSTSAPVSKRPLLQESDLTPEQLKAIDRLYGYDETLLIAKLGFGKAIVGLTAAQEMIRDQFCSRVLVLAPLRVATLTWGTEPEQWEHITVGVSIACGTVKQREAAIAEGASIVVTNFENVPWIIEHYGDQFDGVIIDELTKLKKPGGAAARKLRHFVKRLKWRVGMTGTPLAETGTDLYSQAMMLDLGKALGTRFDAFRETYFYPEDYLRHKWLPRPEAPKLLAQAMRNLVFVADDQGYQDSLPPVENHIMTIDMPVQLTRLYGDMEAGVVEHGGYVVAAASAGVKTIKLHGLAAGGLYGKNEDDGQELVYFDDYKIRALAVLVTDLPGPVIVCYQYGFELDALKLRYPDAPVLGQGNKVKPELIGQWDRGEHPVLIMHHASAAHGLNLQRPCNTIIHLSPVWGADPWAQCLGRIRRRGQPADVVHRYVLVARGSKDEDALAGIDMKLERESAFMEALG